MAKKTSRKTTGKTASKKGSKKTSAKKSATKGKKRAARKTYSDSLKKKVVSAIKKGMTHLEASKAFEVGIHSIPNWIKRHV